MQRRQLAQGRPWRFVLGVAMLVLAAVQGAAEAQQTTSAYTVQEIAIEKTAASGVLARQQGLDEARQAAYVHLYERLVPQTYYGARPALGQPDLNALIAAVDIVREQTTASAYRAELAISFSRARVRDLLNARQIPFTDRVSPPLLVLPVYEWVGARQLWEVPNPWHTAWSERVGPRGLLDTVMAAGSAEDQLQLSADQALAGDSPGMQQLARAYRASGAIVALGQLRVDPRTGAPVLDVTLRGYGAAPAGPITQTFTGAAGGRAALAAEQLTRTAAAAMADALAAAWKIENLQRGEIGVSTLRVTVPLAFIGDYADALRRIAEVRSLNSAVLARLTATAAEFDLKYSSDLEQLQRAFDSYGMRLVQEPGGWVLRIHG